MRSMKHFIFSIFGDNSPKSKLWLTPSEKEAAEKQIKEFLGTQKDIELCQSFDAQRVSRTFSKDGRSFGLTDNPIETYYKGIKIGNSSETFYDKGGFERVLIDAKKEVDFRKNLGQYY